MDTATKLLLFGEDASDLQTRLRGQIIESRTNPSLNALFQRAGSALRYEIGLLSPLERQGIPHFSTLDELNTRINPKIPHAGVQNALLCLSQIAQYLK